MIEILDAGAGPGRHPGWLRRHPVAVALGVTALLAAAGLAAVRSLPPGGLPRLVVAADPERPGARDPWTVGPDGRPATPVQLSVSATVRLAVPAPGQSAELAGVTVLGLAGPGISGNDLPPVDVPVSGAAVPLVLRAAVDCTAVPEVVPADAYGLLVRAGLAAAGRGGVVTAGEPGASWGRAVQLACATWTARRDLTVTSVGADVDPRSPRLDATLTVTNAGSRAATLTRAGGVFPDIDVSGALPVTVPPHGSVTVPLTVGLRNCDRGAATAGQPDEFPDLTTVIGVAAMAGPAPVGPAPFADAGEGSQPSGVVLSPRAGAQLLTAIRAACGDLGTIVVLVPPGGVRLDPAHGEVAVDGLVDLPPHRVATVTLTPGTDVLDPRPPGVASSTSEAAAFAPTFTSVGPLVPDASGQVRFTVRFRSGTAPVRCLPAYALPPLTATVRVPTGDVVREVRYPLFLDLSTDPASPALTCP